MTSRIIPSPAGAERLLQKLKGLQFNVVGSLENHAGGPQGAWTREAHHLDDADAAREALRRACGWSDLEVMVDGDFMPPGEYPLSRLTVVVSREGVPIRAFFG